MKRRIGALPSILLGLLWSVSSLAEGDSFLLHLDSTLNMQTVAPEFVYSPADLEPEVVADFADERWRLLNKGTVEPSGDKSIWLRFAVSNNSDQAQERWLVVAWPLVEHLQMHILTPEGERRWSSQPVGENHPLIQRPKQHRHFLFPLTLSAGELATVYLEVRSTKVSVLPIEIWNYEAFVAADQLHLLILGAVFGSLAIMFFYNLSLYSMLRDRVYLYYCGYVAAVFLHILVASGFGLYYLWDESPWLKERSMPIFAGLSFFSAAFFIRHFLTLKHYGGWVLAVNNFFLLLWAAVVIFGLLAPLSTSFLLIMNLAALLSLPASMATGCYLWWWRHSATAKIFVLAWTALNVGTGVFVLMLQGVLPLNIVTRYSQMAGIIVELAIVSFALAHRINEAKLASEKANQEALRLSRQMSEERAERLRAQIATLEAQKKLNEELEVRVQQRTEQLNETLQKLEHVNNELRQLSSTDPLTDVHNRRYLDEMLEMECKRANRTGQHLAVILLDIDHFKSVNDHYGHAMGDKCLKAVAAALGEVAKRPGDLLARYGGEEFVFVLPNTDEAQALQIAEKSRRAVAALAIDHDSGVLRLTISAGVAAAVPDVRQGPGFLLKAADQVLYKAKDEGRNRVMAASQLVPDLQV